jgi:predicted amidohydrolase
MNHLLIRGGRVIDPAQNIDGLLDVLISNGRISKIGKELPPQESQQIFDAWGKIVTPGLIDVHFHVYHKIYRNGADPDDAGVRQGVTTGGMGEAPGRQPSEDFPVCGSRFQDKSILFRESELYRAEHSAGDERLG